MGRFFDALAAPGFGAIATPDQIEPFDVTRLDCGNDFICQTENHAVMEADR